MDKAIMNSNRKIFLFTTAALVGSGLAATLGSLAIAGAGVGAASMMGGGSKRGGGSSAIPTLPAAPTGAEATSAEKARIRKKTKTLLTGPLSGDEYYGGAAPTLLGSGDVTKKQVFG